MYTYTYTYTNTNTCTCTCTYTYTSTPNFSNVCTNSHVCARRYTGIADCAARMIKAEGILSLWKGAGPAWIKLAPHTVISFVVLDTVTKFYTGKSAL
jgi:hypothetical protein